MDVPDREIDRDSRDHRPCFVRRAALNLTGQPCTCGDGDAAESAAPDAAPEAGPDAAPDAADDPVEANGAPTPDAF
jgi:hypothetical protein